MMRSDLAHAALDELRGTAHSDTKKLDLAVSALRPVAPIKPDATEAVLAAMSERETLWPGYDTTIEV